MAKLSKLFGDGWGISDLGNLLGTSQSRQNDIRNKTYTSYTPDCKKVSVF